MLTVNTKVTLSAEQMADLLVGNYDGKTSRQELADYQELVPADTDGLVYLVDGQVFKMTQDVIGKLGDTRGCRCGGYAYEIDLKKSVLTRVFNLVPPRAQEDEAPKSGAELVFALTAPPRQPQYVNGIPDFWVDMSGTDSGIVMPLKTDLSLLYSAVVLRRQDLIEHADGNWIGECLKDYDAHSDECSSHVDRKTMRPFRIYMEELVAEPVAAEPNQAAPTNDITVPTHGRNSGDHPILTPDLGSDGKDEEVAFRAERESNVVSDPKLRGRANDALTEQLKNNGIADQISRVYSDMRKTRPGLALSPTVKFWFVVDDQGKALLEGVDMSIMKTIMPGEKPYDEATRQSIEAEFEQAIRVACQRLPSLPKAPESKVYLLRYPLYINVVN